MKAGARIRVLRERPLRADGDHVLYWMTAARRTRSSHALDRAIAWAEELGKPLWVLEPLRFEHEHASERLSAFVVHGMADNARAFADTPVGYFPYLEPEADAGKGLLEAFAARACVVVGDDWPVYFLRRMVEAAANRLEARLELVDGVGLVPMSAPDRCFARAHDFRRWCQKNADLWLGPGPNPTPLAGLELPAAIEAPVDIERWRTLDEAALADPAATVRALGLPAGGGLLEGEGGSADAAARLETFVGERLANYGERNQPAARTTSELSAHLHWGHIGAHEVLDAVLATEPDWSPAHLSETCRGQREGWWGLPAAHEGYLDQLLTWREVGHNFVWHREDYDRYASLPAWAKSTLAAHAGDPRPSLYSLEQFERAQTHDEIWNAAQRELVATGRMHNYLRMLWGKKILHWTPSPQKALEIMITLNDRYALDGRDPNSYSGIFWVLGRYDRAWGPEREVFGKIRYMSSDSTRRKLRLGPYLEQWGDIAAQAELFGEASR